MLGFGIAYAGSALNNGVTDFSGKTYDRLEISAAAGAGNVHEGSAAGGVRLTENETVKLHNAVTDFSGRSYDTFEISTAPADNSVAEGSGAGGPRRNLAAEETSVGSYEELNLTM